MKTRFQILLMVLFSAIWMSCSFSHSDSPDNTTLVKTTIAGQVVDESGNALSGALVQAYGKTVTTNSFGTFVMSNIDVPLSRFVVKVSKSGYFSAYRAEQPIVNGLTQIRCGLMSDAITATFSSASGSKVSVAGGASISFPANGYVNSSGTAYTGTVNVAARLLSPASTNFYDFFAGDFQGKSSDGSFATLLSFGVLRVELKDAAGNMLNLATGSTAQLTAPIPAGMSASASIPLWHFDESLGMWKEEGSATKQGSNFVGSVQHFSDWNFDAKSDTASLHIRVHCDDDNVPGVVVNVGERTVVTDTRVTNIRRVQGGIPIIIKVRAENNGGLESVEQTVGPLSEGQSLDVDLPLIVCPAYITGTLLGCDNEPIDGTIYGEYASGGYFFGFVSKGVFKVRVKSGEDMTVMGISADGRESNKLGVAKLNSSEKRDIGSLTACGGSSFAFKDVDLQLVSGHFTERQFIPMKLSGDGSTVYALGKNVFNMWDVNSGTLRKSIPTSTTTMDSIENINLEVSDNESIALVPTSHSTWETYDIATSTKLQSFSTYNGAHLSPDGSKVITLAYSYDATKQQSQFIINCYNARTGQLLSSINKLNGAVIETVTTLADFINNNEFVLSTSDRKGSTGGAKVYVLNTSDGSITQSFDVAGGMINAVSQDGSVVSVWNYMLNALQYSFYNPSSGTKISTISPQLLYYGYYPLAIHPDNQRIAMQAGDSKDSVRLAGIFSLMNGLLLKPLIVPSSLTYLSTMSFSADGKFLAAAYYDKTTWKVRVWSL